MNLSERKVSPNEFSDGSQTERINKALTELKNEDGGTLELGMDTVSDPPTDTWVITESIRLPSRITLFLNECKLKLADGVFDTIIRNEGIVVDEENPNGFAKELRHDSDIRIIGSGIGSAFIEGPDVPFAAPHPVNGGEAIPWVGDFYGWRTVSILFANCSNYEIGGFSISKTTCWAISQEQGCEGMRIHDIDFDTNVKNGDGIDFRKGCSDGVVENITGACFDDVVACTALIRFCSEYPRRRSPDSDVYYVFPMEVGGNVDGNLRQSIENIQIRNVKASSTCHVIICLAAGGAKVSGIQASNIEDGPRFSAANVVSVYTGYGEAAAMGDISDIHMKNIVSNNSRVALKINTPLVDSSFEGITQRKEGGVECEITSPYESRMRNVRIDPAP
ncbi:MAG: hypothetical protein KAG97_11280 [Victivallales bacterium]|nr:hypothetical protein [Victivallales bacterium]